MAMNRDNKNIWTSQLKEKMLASLAMLSCGALLVSVNYLAGIYNLRKDLTKARQHTLSKQTKEYLKHLKKEVKFTALLTGLPPKYLEDLFREYERVSRGIVKTKIVDPIVDIGYAAQFGNIIDGKQKKVVVQSDSERRDIDFTEEVLTEESLTNAILRITRDARNICFVQGHGEYRIDEEQDKGLSLLAKLLAANNMSARPLFIEASGGIPKDCDVLAIAGAQKHVTEMEEKKIDEYLKDGGDALFLVEHVVVTTPDQPLNEEQLRLNPSLNGILKNWGIKINDDVVVDLQSHASGDVGSPATDNYMAHRAIVSGLDYSFYIRPRSISIISQRRETLKLAPLVLTKSTKDSWGESDRTLHVKYDEILDRPGPVPIAFVIWEPKERDEPSDTRIVVFTDADFLTNRFIGSYSHAQLGINVVNWLSELDYKVFIDPKTIEVTRLELTSAQKRFVLIVLTVIPVMILLLGIVVWGQRR